MKLSLLISVAAFMCGCAASPQAIRVGLEHNSHPFVGWPFEKLGNTEDTLNQGTVVAVWRGDLWYVEAGFGRNLKGRNGDGFYGPATTGVFRAGMEFKLKDAQ